MPWPPSSEANSQQAACIAESSHISAAVWKGGSAADFERHVIQLETLLSSELDALAVVKHWEDHLIARDKELEPAPLDVPQCGQWLYLYFTDMRLTALERSQHAVLAMAGHALAQRVVLVDKVNHANFFSGPLELQREVAKLDKDCCLLVP